MSRSWESLLYTQDEIDMMYDKIDEEVNRNHQIRTEGKSFSEFVEQGCDALIREDLDFVKRLL